MLYASLLTSTTGIQAGTSFLDVVSNNVANLATTGFKTTQISFEDLLYTGPTASGTSPTGSQVGLGTQVDDIASIFTQGPLTPTGRPFDLAIDGPGFFEVDLGDGTTAYTRAGNFTLDAAGQLVTSDGYIVSPGIVVPENTSSVSIAADGTVTAFTSTGRENLGQITLTQFQNPGGLLRIGDTLFAPTAAAGEATTGAPGADGLGTIRQATLEGSNVDLTTELINLIIAQRAVQFNSQALLVADALLRDTTALLDE